METRAFLSNATAAWLKTLAVMVLAVLAMAVLAGCGSPRPTAAPIPTPTPTVIRDTQTIAAGRSVSWDVSAFEACQYHFTVRQTGTLGSVDIEFQGSKHTEKDGVFYGDTFTLNNGYSLNTAKVVDVRLQCR